MFIIIIILFYFIIILFYFLKKLTCQGLKKYSEWPTYPQLYVEGEFIGGCDIILEMEADGELKSLV